ncbi:MAG: HAD-IA family hydrolase [Devosia sp.]
MINIAELNLLSPQRPRTAKDMPHAVLFDLDGTLVDSVPDITLAVAELMATEDLAPFPETDVREMVGHGVRPLVARAFAARGRALDPDALRRMVERMVGIYPRHLTGRTTLMPGAMDCLNELSARGCAMAVVTNKLQGPANTVLAHFGLTEYFGVILGDQARPSGLATKPQPDMLLFALSRLGVTQRDAIMIGDSAADIGAASNAGIFSVGLRNGYSSVPLENLSPGAIIDDLTGLPSALAVWRDQ